MNEFRLYWWDRAPAEYIRFFIRREDLLSGGYDLLSDLDDARFDRYVFAKLFSRDMLLSKAGRPQLLRLVERQADVHRDGARAAGFDAFNPGAQSYSPSLALPPIGSARMRMACRKIRFALYGFCTAVRG